ncbi:Leucine-rich repeat serine/threonine-protein kinase 1 [Halotydeus destructor]|nr:Leucine-rich repeat serine/threonine-protein kinase 1 [Halotydeus destructor]
MDTEDSSDIEYTSENDELGPERRELFNQLCDLCYQGKVEEVRNLLSSTHDSDKIVNGSLSGSNTLLFKACEDGHEDIVRLLLEHKADGRVHPVTKYSPLFISSYHGRKNIVRCLLEKFPELASVQTVEKWLPLHAAAINNHVDIVEQLLKFNYPSHLLKTYQDRTNSLEYTFAYDVNTQDVSGQTVLYIAAFLGNQRLVDFLLGFKVPAKRLLKEDSSGEYGSESSNCDTSTITSPRTKVRSASIQSIISKLSQSSSSTKNEEVRDRASSQEAFVCPMDVSVYCSNQTETALHVAIKSKHYSIASQLLQSGADPNLPILANQNESADYDASRFSSTSLKEACKNRDASMVDLLIRYGARDDDCQALVVASSNNDNHLMSKLLALKSFPDPEYKINRKAIELPGILGTNMMGSVTFSSMFPTAPVMINWHSLGCLTNIRKQWLMDASIVHNIKLKLNLQNQATSLLAITRLDLSNNGLLKVPICIFQMASLRILVLSQNRLESLPETDTEVDSPTNPMPFMRMKKSNSYSVGFTQGGQVGPTWTLPCLEELYLQDNRLETVPSCVFDLPTLQLLDLSNNKLRCIPYRMWFSPKLRDLNVSMNLLRELPARIGANKSIFNHSPMRRQMTSDSSERSRTSSRDKPVSQDSSSSNDNQDNSDRSETENTKVQVLKHFNLWANEISITSTSYQEENLAEKNQICKLSLLNLSHNGFTSVPQSLSCFATSLTRLNLSYNCLTTIGSVKLFPVNIKHLDLSFNQLNSWSRVDLDSVDCLCCSSENKKLDETGSPAVSREMKNIYCIHKQHCRLDNLRSLVLSNNHLCSLNLLSEVLEPFDDFDILEKESRTTKQTRLLFPNISMLDVSNNTIREIPVNICELTNLSVLHLNGNREIGRLPPEMGLLGKLWNLGLRGCSLNEPLKTMVDSKKYKTMDIIGYLKSILEDSRPYARMKLMVVGLQGIGKTSLLEQLRQEGTGTYRKRPPEHWGKRMGNKNLNLKTPKGVTLSTVGVDVCDWTYERKVKGLPSYGPVTFRTWDFGGQKEYYSTHQYFLSKRSLYLVCWKMIDGERAVNDIQQWLVNIQTRAPNAPVIIVGTHYDVIREFFPPFYSQELQATIREKFMNIVDPDKCGLPRVLDSIEISTKTKHNVKLLCNLIYDTVFAIRCPGSKERMLEQKIPATYLALEDVIGHLAAERRSEGRDPVMKAEDYRNHVMAEMYRRYRISFRDLSELHQATAFLHENGVLLHYEDATLKDLYFLDPQWLCDILAHVVTIKEINPYAKNGIMQTDDLKHLFKASSCAPVDTKTYIMNLLNKFEVALTWDSRTLLIPSLLPTERSLVSGLPGCDVRVKIPVRSRGWTLRNSRASAQSESTDEVNKLEEPKTPTLNIVNQPEKCVYRLLLMTYFPSGFWSRLMTRLLGDDSIIDIVRSFYNVPKDAAADPFVISSLNRKAEWTCWQTGVSLRYVDNVIFRIKEVVKNVQNQPLDYSQPLKFVLLQESHWVDLELDKSSILEIFIPCQVLKIETESGLFSIEPNQEYVAKLLSLTVDHIDTLLEDWYPSLGTRFVHTSEGRFLVTRLVPCLQCMNNHAGASDLPPVVRESPPDTLLGPRDSQSGAGLELPGARHPVSMDSVQSTVSHDSDIGYESAHSSKPVSRDVLGNIISGTPEPLPVVYNFLVEECIVQASENKPLSCPAHGEVQLKLVAPDIVFGDLGDNLIIKPEVIRRGKMLGRGAFGFVFRATLKSRTAILNEVAMKMLQPVEPGQGAKQSDNVAYKLAWNKWESNPLQYACKSYCTARQELNILLTLRHPHIVPLIGVCTRPLALILSLAPLGALDVQLRQYRRSGVQLNVFVIQKILYQISKALEYLHQQRIIYRDLKSENVLVWKMPTPYELPAKADVAVVDVKLADYGISRSTLPTGSKGFGGTEGFMAPEIMRHNGEEEYTEKVDCFSFGMFMYELLTLHLPFEGQECIKDHILDGGRPPMTSRDLVYPSYMLDLMVLCWSEAAKDRPATSQIVSIVSAPEFVHMMDVVPLVDNMAPLSASVVESQRDNHFESWISRTGKQLDILGSGQHSWQDYKSLTSTESLNITSSCPLPDRTIWLGDSMAAVHVFTSDGTYKQLSTFKLDPDSRTPTAVRDIVYCSSVDLVAIATTSGRLWLCDRVTHKLREVGNNDIAFLSMTFVATSLDEGELWCGQAEGRLCVITIKGGMITSQEVLSHYSEEHTPIMERLDVFNLVAEFPNVWTYLYPGSVVYRWHSADRKLTHKLDCSKLAPCSESLMSISIEEHLTAGKCQVTCIAVRNDELFIGTSWGCLIVVEGSAMRPVTVFRPHEDEIKSIIPFESSFGNDHDSSLDEVVTAKDVITEQRTLLGHPKYLMTIGKGYRSLVSRYIYLPKEKRAYLSQKGIYSILWKSNNWAM